MSKYYTLPALALIVGLSAATLPANAAGRYSMTPTEDGMLRLDTETGEVSMCQKDGARWSCSIVEAGKSRYRDQNAGDRRSGNQEGLRARLDRLEAENRRLRRQQSNRGLENKELQLPSEEDVDKVVGFVERMLKRFNGLIEDLKKEREPKGTPL